MLYDGTKLSNGFAFIGDRIRTNLGTGILEMVELADRIQVLTVRIGQRSLRFPRGFCSLAALPY